MPRIRLPYLFVMAIAVSNAAYPNKAHDVLSGKSEKDRNFALAQFMAKSGESCGQVTKSFLQGQDKSGKAFWNVQCSNKKSFSIIINNDNIGSTRILDCSILKAVAGVECFKKF